VDFIRSIDGKFEQYDDSGKFTSTANEGTATDEQRLGLRLLMISSITSERRSKL
jgi:hypothetical protein